MERYDKNLAALLLNPDHSTSRLAPIMETAMSLANTQKEVFSSDISLCRHDLILDICTA